MRQAIIWSALGVGVLTSWAFAIAGGFLWGFSYSSARDASFSALVEASALKHIRNGNLDEGLGLLETRIDVHLHSHLDSVWAEELFPEVWIFNRSSHRGLAFVSSYRAENPRGEKADEVAESILSCYAAQGLPAPASSAYRAEILDCYDRLRSDAPRPTGDGVGTPERDSAQAARRG